MAKIRIYSGRLIDPFNPQPEDIEIESIIHSLSIINRFHGNSKYPYSVAQHSSILARYVPKHLAKAAIIHDWSESWFNDLASPIKKECKDYKKYEKACNKFFMDFFEISPEIAKELDHYDKAIYINERDILFEDVKGVGMGDKRIKLNIPDEEFRERDWREVKDELTMLYYKEYTTIRSTSTE